MNEERLNEIKRLIDEVKCIKKRLLSIDGRFLRSEVYECELNNGKFITREKLIKGNGNGSAAIILPITIDNKIVVSIEPRVFSKTGVGVSLPAGYVEDGESYIEAAKRELLEETGYVSDMLIPLGGFYQDIGCSSAFNESFVALGCIGTNVQHLDEGEFVKYVECSSEEIDYLLNNNYIVDGNAILTLLKGRKYIK